MPGILRMDDVGMAVVKEFVSANRNIYPVLGFVLLAVLDRVDQEFDGNALPMQRVEQINQLAPPINAAMNAPGNPQCLDRICTKMFEIFPGYD
jgi:hypothetical protein